MACNEKILKHGERFDLLNITWEWIRVGQDREDEIMKIIVCQKVKVDRMEERF